MDQATQLVQKIKDLLDSKGITYDYLEHEPTPTSEDAARVRGTTIEQGAKALILVGKKTGKNYMAVIPGHKKLDTKKIVESVGEKVEFENPEKILEKFGIQIGGVPPFGNLLGLETFVDESIGKDGKVAFNCGERTCSIMMESKDLIEVIGGNAGNYSK